MTAFKATAGARPQGGTLSVAGGGARGYRRAPVVRPAVLSPSPSPKGNGGAGVVAVPVQAGDAAFPYPMPTVGRNPVRRTIDWTPELLDWLYACRVHGVAVVSLAKAIGCSTQTIFATFNRDVRGVPEVVPPPEKMTVREFVRLGKGMAEDMPASVLEREIARRPTRSGPIGPFTRMPPRRTVGRALTGEGAGDGSGDE